MSQFTAQQVQLDAFGNAIQNTGTVNGATGVVANTNNTKKPKAKYWLNIGLVLPNPKNPEETQFVQVMGCGVGLDTVNRQEIKGSLEFQQLLGVQSVLLDNLIERAKSLPVGESTVLPHMQGGFAIQLTHADTRTNEEKLAASTTDNPYMDMLKQLGVTK